MTPFPGGNHTLAPFSLQFQGIWMSERFPTVEGCG